MALQGPQRPNFGARPASPPSGSPQVDGLGEELAKQGRVTNQQQARDWARAVVQAIKREGLLGVDLKQSLVGSSRVDLQACKLEYSIVSPK